MAQIRDAMGEDAVIVATREDEAGGVRVTAAVEDPDEDAGHRQPAATGGLAAVDAVWHALRTHGVPAALGERLLDLAAGFETSDPAAALAAALKRCLTFAPLGEARPGAPVLLVGPHGAGKTQTAAKLAARALLAGRRVALLTTDTGRAGGPARLAAFARAMGLDLLAADDHRTLADAVCGVAGLDLVVIDSPGRNHLAAADLGEVGGLMEAGAAFGAETVLVLPAGLDAVEAADVAGAYAGLGVRRLAATRLDATRRHGGILAAAEAAGLALAELGTGQEIRDGLMPAAPLSLARLLLAGMEEDTPLMRTGT
jgi:flagellar biosynthesis protein FlhF